MRFAATSLALLFASCGVPKPAPEPPEVVYVRPSDHEGWVEVQTEFLRQLFDDAASETQAKQPSGVERL